MFWEARQSVFWGLSMGVIRWWLAWYPFVVVERASWTRNPFTLQASFGTPLFPISCFLLKYHNPCELKPVPVFWWNPLSVAFPHYAALFYYFFFFLTTVVVYGWTSTFLRRQDECSLTGVISFSDSKVTKIWRLFPGIILPILTAFAILSMLKLGMLLHAPSIFCLLL